MSKEKEVPVPPGLEGMKEPCLASMSFCADNCCVMVEILSVNKKPLSIAQILHGITQIQATILQGQCTGQLQGNKQYKFKWDNDEIKPTVAPAPGRYFGEEIPH